MANIQVKPLSDTFTYSIFNKGDAINKTIMSIMKDGHTITKNDIAQAILTIEKNFKYPTKHKVLEMFDKGYIILKYAPVNVKLPTAMPFFLIRGGSGPDDIKAVVSVDLYGTRDKDNGTVTIDPKKLFTLMESAYFAILYHVRHNELVRKTSIIADGSSAYAHMFARVLNKKYALNVDKTKYNNVIFLASKFYLINILGRENDEVATNYALNNCVNGNAVIIREFDSMLPDTVFNSLHDLISYMGAPDGELRFPSLTTRGYIEQYIIMYDASALLSLEYLPYFIYTIQAAHNRAFINNQNIIEDIIEKSGPRMYVDLTRVGN